ncbi:peptidase [Pedobacter quisquiliarum]|jgi:septal ring factor EnvC (AmiA/AmiB activator)|uniref:Peptidase n=1 Tax=Pedobacter quisquiliarum TaxID=1834438 RepID=A0A916UBX2_9SPHI|nr:peptidoglycan DD-metalloendopeptidase family protein [Pedobacter quisquiliarum]GGC65385.1 peptidase [Pedobacter quisquiliarum]
MKFYKLILFLFLLTFGTTAFAQSSAQLKRKKEALQREINLLQKNLTKTASSKKLTESEIRALNTKINLMQDKIGVINSEIRNLDGQIHENTNAVLSLKEQLAQLKKEYAAMIRFAQRNQNAYDKMMFIFAAKDFNQAYKRVKYLQQFSQYRKKQADYINGTQKNLSYKIVVLDKSLKEKSNLLKEQESEKEKLGKNKSEQSKVLNKYSQQERKYSRDIAARKKQQAKIDRDIRNAIQREIALAKRRAEEAARAAAAKARAENKAAPEAPTAAAKTNSGYLNATPEAAKLSAAFINNRGSLPWPVASGSITERFGRHKVDQANIDQNGVKIATAAGAAVRAVFNGKVTTVNTSMGKYYVLIKHGEYFTVYQNLASVSVSVGQEVSTKQTIGVVSGSDGVPEIDFQIWRGASPQNPEAWISK